MDVAEARAEATAAESASTAALATTGTVEPAAAAPSTQETQVAQALGEMAMLLENVELRGLRGPRPPGAPGGSGRWPGGGRFGGGDGGRGSRSDTPPQGRRRPHPRRCRRVLLPAPVITDRCAVTGTEAPLPASGSTVRGPGVRIREIGFPTGGSGASCDDQ